MSATKTEEGTKEPRKSVGSTPKARAKPSGMPSSGRGHQQQLARRLDEPWDVVLPPNWNPGGGECTVLVQVDPDDAPFMELEGVQGVVGRIETDKEGVLLDLKGKQYRGRIYPGPTALVLSMVSKGDNPHLKVDAITDEFLRLEALGESISKLHAKTTGDMEDYMVHDDEEDVNRNSKMKGTNDTAEEKTETAAGDRAKKRKSTTGSIPGPAKKKNSTKRKT